MKLAPKSEIDNRSNRRVPRIILGAVVVLLALSILTTGLVLLFFQIFIWDQTENVEFSLWLLNRPFVGNIPLILVLGLYCITLVDFVMTKGWSRRTCVVAICMCVFNVYAIIYYWSHQLWLAKHGKAPDGLALQFSLRHLLIAVAILSFTIFALLTLFRSG
jgi:hypothetical protein